MLAFAKGRIHGAQAGISRRIRRTARRRGRQRRLRRGSEQERTQAAGPGIARDRRRTGRVAAGRTRGHGAAREPLRRGHGLPQDHGPRRPSPAGDVHRQGHARRGRRADPRHARTAQRNRPPADPPRARHRTMA